MNNPTSGRPSDRAEIERLRTELGRAYRALAAYTHAHALRVHYEIYALERATESQRRLAAGIDKDNPEDPYAALAVWDDIVLLESLAQRLKEFCGEPK